MAEPLTCIALGLSGVFEYFYSYYSDINIEAGVFGRISMYIGIFLVWTPKRLTVLGLNIKDLSSEVTFLSVKSMEFPLITTLRAVFW